MGAQLGGAGAFNDINMTPLIDIVLVVLIIMMVSIPIQVNELGVKVPNPEINNTPPPTNDPPEQFAIALYADGQIALNRKVLVKDSSILMDTTATVEEKDTAMLPLASELTLRLKSARKKNVFIDAHPDVNFGIVVDIMDLAKESGVAPDGIRMAKMKENGPLEPTSVGNGVLPRGVMTGSPTVVGSITEVAADRQLRPYVPKFRACYEQVLATKPKLTGRILIRVEVLYDGEVTSVAVDQTSMDAPELDQCLLDQLQELRLEHLLWPEDDGKKDWEHTAAILYPLLFSPG